MSSETTWVHFRSHSSPSMVGSSKMHYPSGTPVQKTSGRRIVSYVVGIIALICLSVTSAASSHRLPTFKLDQIVSSNVKSEGVARIVDSPHFEHSGRILARSQALQKEHSHSVSLDAIQEVSSLGLPAEVTQNWAAYTPWKPAGDYTAPPDSCTITQVNLLQRHGARFPTSGAAEGIVEGIQKLQNATQYLDSRFDFLKNFTYDLGTSDLIPFGASQSFASGQAAWGRYSGVVKVGGEAPFVRASSSQRVVDTATNWTAGFANVSLAEFAPILSVVLSEDANDTLEDNMCTDVGDSDAQLAEWLSVFGPNITAHLNDNAPGANLTDDDTYSIMSMCAFHTLVLEKKSPFCDLFEEKDWAAYEYYGDLDKFYGNGYGQALGPVQGVGYVNELLARLTDSPVQDHTQTNSTLDTSPSTFPLNRTFYADFSHDNEIISIIAAMGLFKQYQLVNQTLAPTAPNPKRTWIASKIVPFSGRMVIERLECGATARMNRTYVRILVNDVLQRLEFCGGVEGQELCELDAFVESQAYARNDGEGDWEKCFV